MKFLKLLGHVVIVSVLTIVTQVGGVIWLLSIFISKKLRVKKRFVVPVVYLIFNLVIVPLIASVFGRTQLPVFNTWLHPQNYFYTLAFRNYVVPELKHHLKNASIDAKASGIEIQYLDACFPFFNGFPLLPHLSHNDGKKIDIAFQYKTKDGLTTNTKPVLFGYGHFPKPKDKTNAYCKSKGYWQYDITKYLHIPIHNTLVFDVQKTKTLILVLLKHTTNEKMFIEPYLKKDMDLQNYPQIRFHGCKAVRQDDHIHLETK